MTLNPINVAFVDNLLNGSTDDDTGDDADHNGADYEVSIVAV